MNSAAIQALRDAFGERLSQGQPLAPYTSARIGGPADGLVIAQSLDDLREAALIAWAHEVPLLVLGGGSNVLVSDEGVRGLVVINRADDVAFEGTQVVAESGTPTIRLAHQCIARGLGGLEWAIGVPGTVGGAVVGNAGAHGGDMASCVAWVTIIAPDGERRLDGETLEFAYRSSVIKRERWSCVILAVALNLQPESPETLAARAEAFNARRKATQPPGATVGSMFKNPPGDFAGRLIEAAGLKGLQRGNAMISPVHANFFINLGGATAHDVKALVDITRAGVQALFGVTLELEIELVGDWGE